jgi:ATP-dependent 26S proteasome regulatory subunit
MNASLCFGNAKKFLFEIRRLEQIETAAKVEDEKNKNKEKEKVKEKEKGKLKDKNNSKGDDKDKVDDNSSNSKGQGVWVGSVEAVSGMQLANIHAYQSTTAMLKVRTHTYLLYCTRVHTCLHTLIHTHTHILHCVYTYTYCTYLRT